MDEIYVSIDANRILTDYLKEKGCSVVPFSSENVVPDAISNHPDVFLCKMGVQNHSRIFFAEKQDLGMTYPEDISFNAACTGRYFIHNLAYTNEALLLAAKQMDMTLVNVTQGYTKCSTVIVDEHSIITYDEGIAKSCSRYPGLDYLLVSPGFVNLPGYNTGFIGGASGRVGNEIIFHGDLSRHPDFERIKEFIESKGLTCKWFPEFELTDIGSIL